MPCDADATNSHNGTFDHADCDELLHDHLQQVHHEIFAYDLKERRAHAGDHLVGSSQGIRRQSC
jgi:hypothetical protein